MSKPTPEENADAIEANADEIEHNAHNIEDNADANTKQQGDIEEITADNPDDAGIQVDGSELPSSNTPKGANQRIKLFAPTPKSIITIGHNNGTGGAYGEQGINLGTEQSLNVTIAKNTKMHSGENRFVQTAQTVTEVAGGDMALSSLGNYKLRTDANVELTAGGSGPAVTPWDVLSGETDAQPPHTSIMDKVKKERTTVENIGGVLSAAFTAIKLHGVALKVQKRLGKAKSFGFGAPDAKGWWKSATVGVDAVKALADAYEAVDGVMDTAELVTDLVADVDDWWSDPLEGLVPGDASMKLHGANAIKLTAGKNISGAAGRSVGFKAVQKISLSGGLSFSAKALGSASMFGMTGSKLDSWGVVKLGSDQCPSVKIKAKTGASMEAPVVLVQGKSGATLISGGTTVVNGMKVVVSGPEVGLVGGKVSVGGQQGLKLDSESSDITMWAKKNVEINSDTAEVKIKAKKKFNAQVNDKFGIWVESNFAKIGDSGKCIVKAKGTAVNVTSKTFKCNSQKVLLG